MTESAPSDIRAGRRTLSPDRIVDACIRIADAEGADAVTLRRLGRELGVDATAIYRHFRDKDALVEAAADRLLAEAGARIRPTGDLRADLLEICRHARATYLAHPGATLLVAGAAGPLPSEAEMTERMLALLRDGGLPLDEAVRGFEVLQDYVVGMAVLDVGRAGENPGAWQVPYASLPPDAFPNLTAAAPGLYGDPDARFELGLALLVDGVLAGHRATLDATKPPSGDEGLG